MNVPADPYPSLETINFVLSAVAQRVRATAYRSDPDPGGPVMSVSVNRPERISCLILVAGTDQYEDDCELILEVARSVADYLDGQAVGVGVHQHWESAR